MAQNNPEALKRMQDLLHKGRTEFEPLLKNNPPPSHGPGEPRPLEDPPPPGMPILSKVGIIILLALAGLIVIVVVLRRRSRVP